MMMYDYDDVPELLVIFIALKPWYFLHIHLRSQSTLEKQCFYGDFLLDYGDSSWLKLQEKLITTKAMFFIES